MSSYSVRFQFSQTFDVPARKAYDWCTDYDPEDWSRMGKRGTRRVEKVNSDTVLLTDSVVADHGPITKRKLVRLDPARMAWTNTYIEGPNLHSQFQYQIVAESPTRSRLEYIGLQVFYGRRPSAARLAELANRLTSEDSGVWRLLAKEMSTDMAKRRRH